MSEYEIRPGGSLKLKGGVAEGGIVKKKKKKSKSKQDPERDRERERVKELLFQEEESHKTPGSSGRNSPAANSSSSRKTEAEKRFEEVQKRRLAERVAKLANKTHKDRVNEFNAHLESLSEHHDIPKEPNEILSKLLAHFITNLKPQTRNLSQEKLQLLPLGQDSRRKRFWIADDSPRVFVSTNPWKTTATFSTVSSTKNEYLALIEDLKASAPPELKKGERRSKLDQGHITLIKTLENRIEAIDTELARVQKVRKRIEQRRLLMAQAEVRETRTRRQTQRPDYVYSNDFDDSEDDADEYTYQGDDVPDEEFDDDDFLNFRTDAPGRVGRVKKHRAPTAVGQRRSSRAATKLNTNGKRESSSESWGHWRGERRSSRLGAPAETQLDIEPPLKRARTEESTSSTHSSEHVAGKTNGKSQNNSNGLKIKISSAAALKPTEIALEQIAGKKRSKFWVYAVEPIHGPAAPDSIVPSRPTEESEAAASLANTNGHSDHTNGNGNGHNSPSPPNENEIEMDFDRGLEGSLSPLESA
uniref:Uncharacterized protein n=1 Tax=Collybia nuda TaxID=64659 RepID=A0A0K0MMG4_9AGAR|nr:hypothetical protein [Collybia nuda]